MSSGDCTKTPHLPTSWKPGSTLLPRNSVIRAPFSPRRINFFAIWTMFLPLTYTIRKRRQKEDLSRIALTNLPNFSYDRVVPFFESIVYWQERCLRLAFFLFITWTELFLGSYAASVIRRVEKLVLQSSHHLVSQIVMRSPDFITWCVQLQPFLS